MKTPIPHPSLEPKSPQDLSIFAKSLKRKEFLSSLLYNFLLCTSIALVLSAIFGKFWQHFVVSHAIGWTAFGFAEVLQRLVLRDDTKPWVWAVLLGGCVFFGLLIGQPIGLLILGVPIGSILASSWIFHPITLTITALASTSALLWGHFAARQGKRELRLAQNKLQIEQQERQLADAQLSIVRTQVEPHMLFNTLANLRALILIDPDAAVRMLDHLNNYLRTSLSNSRQESISFAQEFEFLRDYLALMQIRLGDRLSFEIDLPDSLQNKLIPTWLLQPLVENAIKHGIEPSANGGKILIRVQEVNQGAYQLTIRNTGITLPADFRLDQLELKPNQGLGLYQTKKRLAHLYADAAQLKVEPLSPPDSGTLIQFVVHEKGAQ